MVREICDGSYRYLVPLNWLGPCYTRLDQGLTKLHHSYLCQKGLYHTIIVNILLILKQLSFVLILVKFDCCVEI